MYDMSLFLDGFFVLSSQGWEGFPLAPAAPPFPSRHALYIRVLFSFELRGDVKGRVF